MHYRACLWSQYALCFCAAQSAYNALQLQCVVHLAALLLASLLALNQLLTQLHGAYECSSSALVAATTAVLAMIIISTVMLTSASTFDNSV
jgi:hypothetical protein